MNLTHNTVLITGGATGIGFSLAEAFLKAGSTVIICGRRESKLLEAQNKYPELNIHVCDVGKDADRRELVTWVLARFPELNVLVNNAGIQRDVDFTKGLDDMISGDDEIRINFDAPIRLTAMLMPHLSKQKNAAILNVSSGLAFVPAVKMPIYCATKAALHSYTMSLRHQLKPMKIAVYEIIPPGLDTDLNAEGRKKRNTPLFGVGPEEFVASVMRDLENDVPEIGYGFANDMKNASRADLDTRFEMMNRW